MMTLKKRVVPVPCRKNRRPPSAFCSKYNAAGDGMLTLSPGALV